MNYIVGYLKYVKSSWDQAETVSDIIFFVVLVPVHLVFLVLLFVEKTFGFKVKDRGA